MFEKFDVKVRYVTVTAYGVTITGMEGRNVVEFDGVLCAAHIVKDGQESGISFALKSTFLSGINLNEYLYISSVTSLFIPAAGEPAGDTPVLSDRGADCAVTTSRG